MLKCEVCYPGDGYLRSRGRVSTNLATLIGYLSKLISDSTYLGRYFTAKTSDKGWFGGNKIGVTWCGLFTLASFQRRVRVFHHQTSERRQRATCSLPLPITARAVLHEIGYPRRCSVTTHLFLRAIDDYLQILRPSLVHLGAQG